MSDEVLFKCRKWDIVNKRCEALHKSKNNSKFIQVKFDINDYDKECKGESNCHRCIGFQEQGFNLHYYRKEVKERCSLRW